MQNGGGIKINAQDFPAAISNTTTSTGNVLAGKTFLNGSSTGLTGTMTDRTKSSITYTSSNTTPVQIADTALMETNSMVYLIEVIALLLYQFAKYV